MPSSAAVRPAWPAQSRNTSAVRASSRWAGDSSGRTAGSWAASGGSAVSSRNGPMRAHWATGPSRGSASAARADADASSPGGAQAPPGRARRGDPGGHRGTAVAGRPERCPRARVQQPGGRRARRGQHVRRAQPDQQGQAAGRRTPRHRAQRRRTRHRTDRRGVVRVGGGPGRHAHHRVQTVGARPPSAVRSSATAMSRCQPRSAVSTARSSRVRSAPACASSASSAPMPGRHLHGRGQLRRRWGPGRRPAARRSRGRRPDGVRADRSRPR